MPDSMQAMTATAAKEAQRLLTIHRILKQAIPLKPQWYGETRDEVVIGAILTQNTNWSNVEKALNNLRVAKLLSLRKLGKQEPGRLAVLIRHCVYHNQKAQRLIDIASVLSECDLPQELSERRKFYLALKGLGPETVDSILLYADRYPVFVIDAYTIRVFRRLGFCAPNISYPDLQQWIEQRLPRELSLYQDFHALIVHLAKDWCRKKPGCGDCPLLALCPTGRAAY